MLFCKQQIQVLHHMILRQFFGLTKQEQEISALHLWNILTTVLARFFLDSLLSLQSLDLSPFKRQIKPESFCESELFWHH